MKKIKTIIDCRHFAGEKPCAFHAKCEPLRCPDVSKFGKRILIIKLAAIGDVLRTTPILPALKKKYPVSHITWLTSPESKEVLDNNPYIDRIYTIEYPDGMKIMAEEFDLVLSLDKNAAALAIASLVEANDKRGFGLSPDGNLSIFNEASRYSFELGFNDELKFRKNRKTYQEITFEMCELSGKYGPYIMNTSKDDLNYAKEMFKKWGIKKGDTVVGLNTGAGKVFLTKKWAADSFAKLADSISDRSKARVLLLGGPDETEMNKYIGSKTKVPVINTGNNHTIKQFMEIVGLCDLVVASDTLAMHLAIARSVPVAALFGSTSMHEVDIYGRGVKISAGAVCAPCYKAKCADMKCMKLITPNDVLEACVKILK